MAIKFQYNKTALQALDKQLKVRERALPTLKNKESALRVEVKKAKDKAASLEEEYNKQIQSFENMARLWGEFDQSLLSISDVELSSKKIAGVFTPVLGEIQFEINNENLFNQPVWFPDGVAIIKKVAEIAIQREVFLRKMELLDFARKKTTQKVNLYEKVQIPGFQDAIRKIKRFLEDQENLSKAAQKIVKDRQEKQRQEEVEV
ncbi:V/A-type H+-transporting ATPase subunit D [Tangfeifania diversioriginum]|uniref:V/A-type H+-transporting ATPase subunit D n=1 Tax=Tangfeifania diversioriginum TaxID=1168035 RepID=A0A1M6M198_9BACT|nr:V-type ATP synthase subunit D [Tangfeifania diversioriginum]SHJ77259.1 V/A-type H+-transporting ATPase subunit D [Tangfeifania diversioriginum]